jgi:hypothetical protein
MIENRKLTGKVAIVFGGARGMALPLPDAWRGRAPMSV